MLIITRKRGQKVQIGESISLVVLEIREQRVVMGLNVSPTLPFCERNWAIRRPRNRASILI